MRTLEFDVKGTDISKNPKCNFDGLIRGSGNVTARFNLSREWNGFKIAASFFKLGEEFPVLIKNGKCEIPAKTLSWKEFSVQIIGMKNGTVIKTNKLIIKQEG